MVHVSTCSLIPIIRPVFFIIHYHQFGRASSTRGVGSDQESPASSDRIILLGVSDVEGGTFHTPPTILKIFDFFGNIHVKDRRIRTVKKGKSKNEQEGEVTHITAGYAMCRLFVLKSLTDSFPIIISMNFSSLTASGRVLNYLPNH